MAVPTGAIIKHFDIVEDIGPGDVSSLVDPPLDALLFQAAEEGLGNDRPDILHSLDQERTLVSFVKMLDLREAIARTALDHVTHIGRVCRIGEDYILDVLGVH